MAADHQRWQTSPLRTAERSSTASSGAAEARTYELHGLMCGGGVAEIDGEFERGGGRDELDGLVPGGGVAEIDSEFGRGGGCAELRGGGVAEIESEFGHSGGVAEIGGEFGRSGGRAELDRLVPRARRGRSWRR